MPSAPRFALLASALLALAACVADGAPKTATLAPPTLALEATATDAALAAAIAGAWRTPANVARDEARKPLEALSFWGLKPGATVIEIAPGGGYWTEILAPYSKATGGTYVGTAADLDNPETSERARTARAEFAARFAAEPYGEVNLVNFGPRSGPLGAPGSADLVLTARNIHNFMAVDGWLDKVLADAFAVLKPGGVLAVEEHRAAPGEQDPKAASGYVTEAYVIAAAEKAGFKLDARSELLANPRDDRDHPFGVWTLAPVRRTAPAGQPADPNFDRAPYDAIGESDRMTLRFVKPAA